MSGPGVYSIVNRVNGRRYVGQSQDVRIRARYHFARLRNGQHTCKPLQRAYHKYGHDAFVVVVLEFCQIGQLDATEQKYLDVGFALNRLYNMSKCAEACGRGQPRSKAFCDASRERTARLMADPEFREKQRQGVIASWTPERRAATSVSQRKRFSDPVKLADFHVAIGRRSESWRAKVVARGTSWRLRPDWVAKHDAAIERRTENPRWQADMAARNRSEPMRQAVKARWAALKADPAVYAAFMEKRSATRKRNST